MARELVGRRGVALRSVDQLYKSVDAVEKSAAWQQGGGDTQPEGEAQAAGGQTAQAGQL